MATSATTPEPISAAPRRVMLYTHNAVGLGHVFRSLAVITGMRLWAPLWDFLVVSGSSVPQAFLGEGVEVLKLPGVRLTAESDGLRLRPRLLQSMSLDAVFDLRSRLLMDALDGFAPEVVLVEHNLAGIMNELTPLLLSKRLRRGGAREFALAHLSRGILRASPRLELPLDSPPHMAGPLDLAALYDFLYVLEDQDIAEARGPYWPGRPDLAGRTAFLGKIGIRTRAELPPAAAAKRSWGLGEAPLILLTLGRFGPVVRMTRALGEALDRCGLPADRQLAVVADPYLDRSERRALEECAAALGARVLGFTPYLVELINAAELVVCRAGYNTCNEVLLSGARALLVPEDHGGREQERRVERLAGAHQLAASEAEVLADGARAKLARLLTAPRDPDPPALDRFAVGRRIVGDLEAWLGGRRSTGPGE